MKFSSTDENLRFVQRRSLLKTGFWGGIFLATVSAGATLTGCATTPAGQSTAMPLTPDRHSYRFLSTDDLVLLTAIAPAIITGNQPSPVAAPEKLLADIDTAIYFFSEANRQEVRKLFDLLNFAPARALLGGVWSSWGNASRKDIEAFLADWKHSSLPLLNKAYGALVKIVSTSWYIQPENWQASGYVGPPAQIMNALPQFAAAPSNNQG
jgi:hypothetical protein